MKTLPGALTPFVRSDAVGAILAETLGHPGEEFSLSALSRQAGVSLPVVHREVGRLIEGEVLRDRPEGRNRLVQANPEHPLFALMSELVAATYGPVPVLRETFAAVEGVDAVLIYGSWAARRAGQAGPYPRDLDVLVVGDVSRRVLAEIAAQAGERLGMQVNITRVSREEWEATEASPFVATVRSRPMIEVLTHA